MQIKLVTRANRGAHFGHAHSRLPLIGDEQYDSELHENNNKIMRHSSYALIAAWRLRSRSAASRTLSAAPRLVLGRRPSPPFPSRSFALA